MAQKDLIPTSKRSKQEAKELGRKGGIKSGEVRREKKLLKDILQTILELKDESGTDNQTKINIALTKRALAGDVKAFEVIRDTLGQKPKDTLELEANISYEKALKKIGGEDEY